MFDEFKNITININKDYVFRFNDCLYVKSVNTKNVIIYYQGPSVYEEVGLDVLLNTNNLKKIDYLKEEQTCYFLQQFIHVFLPFKKKSYVVTFREFPDTKDEDKYTTTITFSDIEANLVKLTDVPDTLNKKVDALYKYLVTMGLFESAKGAPHIVQDKNYLSLRTTLAN